jgi:hypothetical protein
MASCCWRTSGLTFAWGWAAWVPAALLFRGSGAAPSTLPLGLLVAQGVGAVAPSASAYLVLRASGRRDLIRWIGSRYLIWRVHPAWSLVAGLLVPAITVVSLGVRAPADPSFKIAPQFPLGEMVGEIGVVGVALVFPLMTVGLMASSPLLEEFGWRGIRPPGAAGPMERPDLCIGIPEVLMRCLAWVMRLAMVSSSTRKVRAISAVLRPPVGAQCHRDGRAGCQPGMAAHKQQQQRIILIGHLGWCGGLVCDGPGFAVFAGLIRTLHIGQSPCGDGDQPAVADGTRWQRCKGDSEAAADSVAPP